MRNVNIKVGNWWVFPYFPFLSKTYKADVKVGYCNSLKSIKYICNYANKGSKLALFGVQPERRDSDTFILINEITQYPVERYISSNEFGL